MDFNEELEKAKEEYKRYEIRRLFLDYTQDIEKPKAVLSCSFDPDKIVVSEGNFSTIRGAAKSYKSYLCSLYVIDFFNQHPDGICVLTDTEQGDYHASNVARRVCKGLHVDKKQMYESGKLLLAAFRRLSIEERAEKFTQMLEMVREDNPDVPILVILDGARDLVEEANEEKPSRKMVDELLRLTADLHLGMLCVIHTRKDGLSALGHTGGELEKKSEMIIEVKGLEGGGGATVTCLPSRNPEFDEFCFKVDVHGVPYITGKEEKTILPTCGTPKETRALQALPIEEHTAKEWEAIIRICGCCGESTAEKYFRDFKEHGYLIPANKEETHFGHYLIYGKEPKKPNIVPLPTFSTDNELNDKEAAF